MIRYILMLAGLIMVFSCKKNLEKYPLDSLTPAQAFSDESSLQLYVNSFYQMVPSAQAVYGEAAAIQDYYLHGNILDDNTIWDQKNNYLSGGFTSRDAQFWSWAD